MNLCQTKSYSWWFSSFRGFRNRRSLRIFRRFWSHSDIVLIVFDFNDLRRLCCGGFCRRRRFDRGCLAGSGGLCSRDGDGLSLRRVGRRGWRTRPFRLRFISIWVIVYPFVSVAIYRSCLFRFKRYESLLVNCIYGFQLKFVWHKGWKIS